MFTNTAYESYFTYIGLHLHKASIDIITSQKFFLAALLFIFAAGFFFTCWRFFNRWIPGVILSGSTKSLGSFFKLALCLFLGITLLSATTTTTVENYSGSSWHNNTYIQKKLPEQTARVEVSFVFDLLARSSEELARFATYIVDRMFRTANSELEAPSYFYKAILFAGSQAIHDPNLRNNIKFYTEECFENVVPHVEEYQDRGLIDLFFSDDNLAEEALAEIELDGPMQNCLQFKQTVSRDLRRFADEKVRMLPDFVYHVDEVVSNETITNYLASQALVTHYTEQHEDIHGLGIHQAAMPPGGTTAKVFQVLNRVFSWDGFLSIIGFEDKHGASATASRAQEFSELLQRAPHVKGIARMILMLVFPWLVFLVVAGRWKVLIFWTAVYFSVLMWTPIWTLFYHLMTSIALSAEAMKAFGTLSQGISLYGSELITSRLYHFYEVYTWIQVLVGPVPTAILAWQLAPLLKGTPDESTPNFIGDSTSTAARTTPYLNYKD